MTVSDLTTTKTAKFQHKERTAEGEPRAHVQFAGLKTLWFNTGTLCNIECRNCYIESSPENDRLSYLTCLDALPFLDEAKGLGAHEVGFTGGEPFMNPEMPAMAELALAKGFRILILTNAMKPMMRPRVQDALLGLKANYSDRLRLRVSLDHYQASVHDHERGAVSFQKAVVGLRWLAENGFQISVAGRAGFGESDATLRRGFEELFRREQIPLDAHSVDHLLLFPEMDERVDVPEITDSCWSILGKQPADVMCSDARMVVKRRQDNAPVVLACTLLAYEDAFELGKTLRESMQPVFLNHPHCAKFCVLGGASCSG